jgi:hypothetical protein
MLDEHRETFGEPSRPISEHPSKRISASGLPIYDPILFPLVKRSEFDCFSQCPKTPRIVPAE